MVSPVACSVLVTKTALAKGRRAKVEMCPFKRKTFTTVFQNLGVSKLGIMTSRSESVVQEGGACRVNGKSLQREHDTDKPKAGL